MAIDVGIGVGVAVDVGIGVGAASLENPPVVPIAVTVIIAIMSIAIITVRIIIIGSRTFIGPLNLPGWATRPYSCHFLHCGNPAEQEGQNARFGAAKMSIYGLG